MIILSEINQTEKDMIPHDITYIWKLKNDPKELLNKTETHL